MQLTETNIAVFPSPRWWSRPAIPASDSTKRAFKNWQPAGARRLKAARIAALESLPVRVVKLTDAEAIEAQVVELSMVGETFFVNTQHRWTEASVGRS